MILSFNNSRQIGRWTRLIYLMAVFVASFPPGCKILAQEAHFSQFYTTPLLINPANTGMTDANLRFANNYRNQWAKIGVPYKTLYTSLDSKIAIAGKSFGIGALIVHDQSSAYNLAADQFLVSFSYSRIIKNHQFTVGIQPGFVSKAYNTNGLTFGSQFDGTSQQYNPRLTSYENYLSNNMGFFDLNAGIYWRTLIRNFMPSAGFSVSHINRPKASFSSSPEATRLPMKYTFNGQVDIPLSNRFNIVPGMLYSYVSGANELLIGGTENYAISDFFIPAKKIYAITFARVNPFQNLDALIVGGGIKFAKFDIGLSYDINISPLAQASNFNGAFELSLVYTGSGKSKRNIHEPCIIY